jgi:hypothetical protein
MNKIKGIILILIIIISSYTHGQTFIKTSYKIDTNIKYQVEKQIISFKGIPMFGHMDLKVFEDDSLIFDSYSKDKKIQLMTMTSIKKDTIHIMGFAGMFSGVGFYLDIYKDTCVITGLVNTDMPIYKYNKSDTSLQKGLSVPCVESNLTLASKPRFSKNDTICGIIELSCKDFWEVENGDLKNGKQKKQRFQLKAYFKTGEIKMNN